MDQKIKDYIKNWGNKNDKPKNEPEFMEMFLRFIKDSNVDQWVFSGENGYCGFTANLSEYSQWHCSNSRCTDFEFAYGKDFVKVFTGSHHGFWVPEYISLHGDDAKEILGIIKEKLLLWAGY